MAHLSEHENRTLQFGQCTISHWQLAAQVSSARAAKRCTGSIGTGKPPFGNAVLVITFGWGLHNAVVHRAQHTLKCGRCKPVIRSVGGPGSVEFKL